MMCSWYSSVLCCTGAVWYDGTFIICMLILLKLYLEAGRKPIENIDSKVDTSKNAFNSFDG